MRNRTGLENGIGAMRYRYVRNDIAGSRDGGCDGELNRMRCRSVHVTECVRGSV